MRRFFVAMLVLVSVMGLVISGCAQQKAESSKAAIETAKAMETAKEKADYLMAQAKAFYNSKEFQQAIDIAQYILTFLDKDSQAAKDLLEKAKDALVAQAGGAIEDIKKGFSGFGEQ